MNILNPDESSLDFLTGGGEMADLIRNYDWRSTSLGPLEHWPQSLKTATGIMVQSPIPMVMLWGEDGIMIYNDSYSVFAGGRHPQLLGSKVVEGWPEVADFNRNVMHTGLAGKTLSYKDTPLILNRKGTGEEVALDLNYSPIMGENGKPAGVLSIVVETTQRVMNERALATLRELGAIDFKEKSLDLIYKNVAEILANNAKDFPFVRVYSMGKNKKLAQAIASKGIEIGHPYFPDWVDLQNPESRTSEFFQAFHKNQIVIGDILLKENNLPKGEWDIPPKKFAMIPVGSAGRNYPNAIIAVALNPYREIDEAYLQFCQLISERVSLEINKMLALEEETKKAEALAAIDRAKTVFFSNISHEFRTPLTLMLSPLEELLSKENSNLSAPQHQALETTHRNAIRLLKLVNTLLDFSRIESGRQKANFTLVDIGTLTQNLVSNFRSLIEKAGMDLNVHIHPIHDPVYVDRQMWEKIVFNLLSNAYKYTLEGSISVTIKTEDDCVILEVSDTGVGIPESDLPKMFERFHRVQSTTGRSFEGTGIGLSLIKELVHLHHGTISVESVLGEGSTFLVKIPTGNSHIPQHQLSEVLKTLDEEVYSDQYLPEDEMLLGSKDEGELEGIPTHNSTILIVDDNADMREHLRSLLQDRYAIRTARHGQEALEKIQKAAPDLILTDVMMPVMDGITLLKEVKSHSETENIPVILLTARAGEESRIEGLEIGADDYLVKPFSAKELIARINSQLKIGEARNRISESEKSLQSFFHHIPAAIAIFKMPEQVFTLANPLYRELVSRTEEQLIGKSVLEVFPEFEGQGIYEMLNSVYVSKMPFTTSEYPATFMRKGKMTKGIFNVVIQPVKNSHGEVTELIVHGVEITELNDSRKKIEANETILNGQKKALEQTFHGQPLGDVLETIVLTAEKQAEKPLRASILLLDEEEKHLLHGAAPSLPQAYNDAIHGIEIGPSVGSCGTAAFTGQEVIVEDIEHDPLWANFKDLALAHELRSCWSTPIFSSQGKLLGTFAVYSPEASPPSERDKEVIALLSPTARIVIEWYQDIENRQKTEAQLVASENQFRVFADHIQNLAWIADGDGWIHWYNQRWYEYTGTNLEEMEGWGWEKVHHPDHIERVVSFVREAWKKDEPWQLIFPLRRHDGVYRTFLTRAYPVKDSSGKIERWIGTNTDIEDQRKFAEELERKVKERTAELQQQNEELASFTYIASHDLQEPLRKIQSFISRLMDRYGDEFSESSKDYFVRISKSASRMQNLIQALLNYSRTNKKEKIFVETDLNVLLEEAKMELNILMTETGTVIESEPLPVIPVIPIQMVQLFSNVLSNAIKYRKEGVNPLVKISAQVVSSSEIQTLQEMGYKNYWKISFEDNGIGFEQQFSSKIFELFQRLHGKMEYSGTGIGLAICKKIAENHFGLIQAVGELGKGATFHLYLPIKQ